MKRLNDAELAALTAIVNQQTELIHGENQAREWGGYSPAYTMETSGLMSEAEMLQAEINARIREAAEKERKEEDEQ